MFFLDDETIRKISEWTSLEMENLKDYPQGENGGVFTYSMTPTTLGLCIEVRNNITQEIKNFTDYSGW